MPSTYSPSLKLELIGNGEQAGTWGTTTNLNLGTLLEQAITGVLPITLTGDVTLTDYNGLSDQARNAVLIFNGLLGAPCNVIAPPSQKVYIVRNRSNATVTIKTTSGNGIAIANAASEVVFCDGTDFYSATAFNYINGNLTVTGTATANNLVATNNITLGKDMFGNASTGQIYIPVGTTGQRAATGQDGLFRYNTTGQFYEGYANGVWLRFVVAPQGNYTLTYLMIAGGGGGGCPAGVASSGNGGGGAGGYYESTVAAIPLTTYTITVGAGGSGSASAKGTNSGITGVTSVDGGGAGGGAGDVSGGSGGGGYGNGSGGGLPTVGGQGNAGGAGSAFWGSGGGGGGAGAAGDPGGNGGGAGGSGQISTITGTGVTRAGGGGGDGYYAGSPPYSSGGAGGSGGGGAGGNGAGSGAGNGTANSGSGGGANRGGSGSGGSGVVIISMPTVNYTGTTTGLPLVSTYGSTTVLQYNNSGTYTA